MDPTVYHPGGKKFGDQVRVRYMRLDLDPSLCSWCVACGVTGVGAAVGDVDARGGCGPRVLRRHAGRRGGRGVRHRRDADLQDQATSMTPQARERNAAHFGSACVALRAELDWRCACDVSWQCC